MPMEDSVTALVYGRKNIWHRLHQFQYAVLHRTQSVYSTDPQIHPQTHRLIKGSKLQALKRREQLVSQLCLTDKHLCFHEVNQNTSFCRCIAAFDILRCNDSPQLSMGSVLSQAFYNCNDRDKRAAVGEGWRHWVSSRKNRGLVYETVHTSHIKRWYMDQKQDVLKFKDILIYIKVRTACKCAHFCF